MGRICGQSVPDRFRERTLAGLKAARARGRSGGRPKKLSPKELKTIRTLLRSGLSEAALEPLALSDYLMVMAKSRANRLAFATWLMFFRDHGRFPREPSDLESLDIAALARQIEVTPMADCSSLKELRNAFAPRFAFDWAFGEQPLPTPPR